MSEPGQPSDLALLWADDALLDALGRGERPTDGDDAAALLAAWRASLSLSAEPARSVALADPPDLDAATPPGPRRLAVRQPGVRQPGVRQPGVRRPGVRRPGVRRVGVWRVGVRRVVAAAALVLVAAGTAAAVRTATPDSPLWPVAAAVDPQRADVLTADRKLVEARRAIGDRRYGDAHRLIDEAIVVANRVRDRRQATRLAAELAEVRRRLSGAETGTVGAAQPAPNRPVPRPSGPVPATAQPGPSAGTPPRPGASGSGGILPSLPIPLPSGILPNLP